MKHTVFRLLATFLICLPALALAELRIAAWNIQHLGWDNDKSYEAVARIAGQYDFLAVQELMRAEAIYKLTAILEAQTGESWSVLYSDRLGTSSYKEKYAFLWRDAAVEYVEGAVTYIDDTDVFAREPFSAVFRARESGLTFAAASVHVVYGQRVSDRTPEIKALRDYWDWLGDIYPEHQQKRMLLGDFNLRPAHPAWSQLKEVAQPLITEGASTLSTNDRQYANLYDNIWVPLNHALPITDSGIDTFPITLTETTPHYWSHEKARAHVSDHAPVWTVFNDAVLHPVAEGELRVPNRLAASNGEAPATTCIDLNKAAATELEQLPHIGPARADDIKAGRPWDAPDELSRIRGISDGRVEEIEASGLLCE